MDGRVFIIQAQACFPTEKEKAIAGRPLGENQPSSDRLVDAGCKTGNTTVAHAPGVSGVVISNSSLLVHSM